MNMLSSNILYVLVELKHRNHIKQSHSIITMIFPKKKLVAKITK